MISMDRLVRRADFVAAARAARAPAGVFLVQARDRHDEGAARIGYTVTKKVGNAVERNRIRRRLRAAARAVVPHAGHEGFDYVLVARRTALSAPYATLVAELERTLGRLHTTTTRDGAGHG
jgi:ribonuclease P protein component